MRVVMVAVVAGVLGAATTAAAMSWWMPWREVASQAYVDASGNAVPRYQWRTVRDERGSGACVVVLTDTTTGAFSVATVPEAACQ